MDSTADRASYLLDAIVRGRYRQVKFYLDAGYDQDYIDNHREGSTPLIMAVTQVKDDVIRNRLIVLLLQAGANPNIGDRHGLTPLMHSILLRQKNSIRLLLDSKRLDYGKEDFDGNSALMHAASLGLKEIATIILERLSAVHRMMYLGQKNKKGLTAGDLAGQSAKKELADMLSWKSSYFLPNDLGFADPRQLSNETSTAIREEQVKPKNDHQNRCNGNTEMWKSEKRKLSRMSGNSISPFYNQQSIDEPIIDSPPLTALQPIRERQFQVRSSTTGIEPIALSVH